MILKKRMPLEPAEMEFGVALRNFRANVQAWSERALPEAEFSRPRAIAAAAPRRIWRRATAWALGCALVASGLSAGIYEPHHRQQLAQLAAAHKAAVRHMAAARAAEQAAEQAAKEAAEQGRRQDENLMASVDKDVSQQVPSAMEPLARLMDETGNP